MLYKIIEYSLCASLSILGGQEYSWFTEKEIKYGETRGQRYTANECAILPYSRSSE